MIVKISRLILCCLVCGTMTAAAQQYSIDSLLQVLPLTKDGEKRIEVLNNLAFAYTLVSVRESEKFVTEAMQLARDHGYKKGLAESLKVLGIINYVRSEYNLATEYTFQALDLYGELNDQAGQSKALNNLAMIFNEQKEYDRAFQFSRQSVQIKRSLGDSTGVANSYLTIAEYYRHAEDYIKALDYCKHAIRLFQSLNDDWGISHASLEIGQIYFAKNNYPFAAMYFNDALRYAQLANDHIQLIAAYNSFGQLYLESRRYDSARVYLQRTLKLAKTKGSRSHELQSLQSLSEYFVEVGRLDSALYYTRHAASLERDIFSSEKQQQITMLQTLYDFETKEQEIGFQKKIVQRQYVAIYGVSIILLLTIFIGYKFYSLNKANRQSKEDLMKLNLEVHSMNANLERLVQERTKEIELQNQRLVDYAFFTAHEVRGPVARILGLIELTKLKDLNDEDRAQILARLEAAGSELDEIIRTINRKLENTKGFTA